MFWVLAQTFPFVLLKPILPGVKFSIYRNSAFTLLFTFCFICSFVFPESVMKQPPQRAQCNVCHELIMPWHLLDNSQDEAFQRYSDKSWTKHVNIRISIIVFTFKNYSPHETWYQHTDKISWQLQMQRWQHRQKVKQQKHTVLTMEHRHAHLSIEFQLRRGLRSSLCKKFCLDRVWTVLSIYRRWNKLDFIDQHPNYSTHTLGSYNRYLMQFCRGTLEHPRSQLGKDGWVGGFCDCDFVISVLSIALFFLFGEYGWNLEFLLSPVYSQCISHVCNVY